MPGSRVMRLSRVLVIPNLRAFCGVRELFAVAARRRKSLPASAVVFLSALVVTGGATTPAGKLAPVAREELCVTEGVISELPGPRLAVNVPKMRAYLNAPTPPVVEAQLTYLGATGGEARLGSGEERRQFGLKLRAQDSCNLVYVMWRIEPESRLVVSVKSNPGEHASTQCGNRGYRNIKARRSTPVPALHPSDAHVLHAEMNGSELRVFVDGAVVWEGSVGAEALVFDGPVGIRSDNARLQIELRAARPLEAQTAHAPGCRSRAEESE